MLTQKQERSAQKDRPRASDDSNGHSAAAHRIVSECCKMLDKCADELGMLSIEQLQSAAKSLFDKSTCALVGSARPV